MIFMWHDLPSFLWIPWFQVSKYSKVINCRDNMNIQVPSHKLIFWKRENLLETPCCCCCLGFVNAVGPTWIDFQKSKQTLKISFFFGNYEILKKSDVRHKNTRLNKGLYECYLAWINNTKLKNDLPCIRDDLVIR